MIEDERRRARFFLLCSFAPTRKGHTLELPFHFVGCTTADPWHSCLVAFLDSIYDRSHAEATRAIYTSTLRTFFRDHHPADATTKSVYAFLHAPCQGTRGLGRAPSAATINQRRAILGSFYRFAREYTITGADGHPKALYDRPSPTASIRVSRATRRRRGLTEEELTAFFAAIPDTVIGSRDRALFLTYFWTARRRAEIIRLRWGDIQQSVLVERGTRRLGWVYHFRGKGKAECDDVAELPQPAKAAIDAYLEVSERARTIKGEDPIFTTMSPGHGDKRAARETQLTGGSAALRFKHYARLAGLSEEASIHTLRHTAALARYQAGEDIYALQHLLRHSDLATTGIYLTGLAGSADPGARLLEAKFAHLSRPGQGGDFEEQIY